MGTSILSLLFCVGCDQQKANAEVPNYVRVNPPLVAAPVPNAPAAPEIRAAEVATTPVPTNAPAPVPIVKDASAAPAIPAAPAAAVISAPTVPANLNISPALGEVVKLIKAGVGEDVLMAYVTNSTEIFELGSDEIVYFHDLGVSSSVITALIQRNASPETQARKQAAVAVQPLPPGVGLNTPATNVFPPKAVSTPPSADIAGNTSDTAGVNSGQAVVVQQPVVVEQPLSYSYFYTSLSPYGSWVDVPGYGSCWRPTVAVCNSNWRPYADNGRWLWSDAGWYWYSDYSWGWAPFHYGRWASHSGIGWVWQPDTVWGPSWVSWRNNGSYCGWAPLPPSAVWYHGRGFRHNSVSVGIGFDFGLVDFHYTWISTARLCDRTPYRHYTSHGQGRTLYKDSTVINNYIAGNNNTIINNGVDRDHVAKVSRGDIRQVALRDVSAARDVGSRRENLDADGRTLTVARPSFAASKIGAPSTPVSALSGIRYQAAQPVSSPSGGGGTSTKPARFTSVPPTTHRSPIAVNRDNGVIARPNVAPGSAATSPKEDSGGIVAKPALSPRFGRPGSSASPVVGSVATPNEITVPRSAGEGGRDVIISKPSLPSSQIGSGNVTRQPSRTERKPAVSVPGSSRVNPVVVSRPPDYSTPSPIARNDPAPRYSAPVAPPSVRTVSPSVVPVQPRSSAPTFSAPSVPSRGNVSPPSAPSTRGATVAPSRGDGGSKASVRSGNSGSADKRSSGGGSREGR